MLLQPGEQIVFSEQVETGAGATKHEGTLYLTNYRILFEAKVGGASMAATQATLVNVHLGNVSNILVSAPMLGRPVLQIETTKGVYSFRTKNASTWNDQIVGARSRAPPPPPPKIPRPSAIQPGLTGQSAQPIVIQLQQSNSQPSVYLHCTHCGTLSPAGSTRCSSCGAGL